MQEQGQQAPRVWQARHEDVREQRSSCMWARRRTQGGGAAHDELDAARRRSGRGGRPERGPRASKSSVQATPEDGDGELTRRLEEQRGTRSAGARRVVLGGGTHGGGEQDEREARRERAQAARRG